ncbi:Uncharacterised protein [Vibrio cholerae]|nr:Uncharacterised protein [Vibrio cholerae]CSB44494.1 Uncharacterised protein [Vibrio cholerae]CSD38202.1 Uncharacterised protein [Vibrio cholerae]
MENPVHQNKLFLSVGQVISQVRFWLAQVLKWPMSLLMSWMAYKSKFISQAIKLICQLQFIFMAVVSLAVVLKHMKHN